MEDYETFVQRRLSELRTDQKDHNKPAVSLIRFHGNPILPPLLSQKDREQMQRHRPAAQKSAVLKKWPDDPRTSHVQTMLQSVRVRTVLTLEELLQESELSPQSSVSGQSVVCPETQDAPPLKSGGADEDDNVSHPASTCSVLVTSPVTFQQKCLCDEPEDKEDSQLSSPLGASSQPSSGYVNYSDKNNSSSFSGSFDAPQQSRETENFFLLNTSNTIISMPQIITHPPVDGGALETNAQDSSPSTGDPERQSLRSELKDWTSCSQGEFESSRVDRLGRRDDAASNAVGPDWDRNDESVSDSLDLSPTLRNWIQHDLRQTEPADSPLDEPRRLSLQALLKKSQAYRRSQRILRNQARKSQDRTQDQRGDGGEEQSLSDKENDVFSHQETLTAEGKKQRSHFLWENHRKIPTVDVLFKDLSTRKTRSERTRLMTGNNQLNRTPRLTPRLTPQPKQISTSPQQPLSFTGTSRVQSAEQTRPGPFVKHHSVPAPKLCRSPTRWTCGQDAAGTSIPKRKVLLGTSLTEDQKVQAQGNVGHHSRHPAVLSTLRKEGGGDVANVLVRRSREMDQLESSLSGLKDVISDLQSTLAENMKPAEHVKKDSRDETLRESPRGQSLDSMHEDTGPEPSQTPPTSTRAQRGQTGRHGEHHSSGTEPHQIPSDSSSVPLHTSSVPVETTSVEVSTMSPSLNQSYDVNTPSGLWFLKDSESVLSSKHLTPESRTEGQCGTDKVKRRLLLHVTERTQDRGEETRGGAESLVRINPGSTRACSYEGRRGQMDRTLQQQKHIQSACSLPEHCCPLLVAAVKGFLTRRLLRTERVTQLVRTFHDTRQFLQTFQEQSPTEDVCNREDVFLQERVALQMCTARYKVYDTFFNLSVREKLQLISWDRDLTRHRRLRQRDLRPRGKSSLSAATQKSLQRKRILICQKRAAENHSVRKAGLTADPQTRTSFCRP